MHPTEMKTLIYVFSLFISFIIQDTLCLRTINLNGDWAVTSNNVSVPGTVPGSMYTALMASGVIGDPYFRRNDEAYAWVGDMDWNYTRSFQVTADLMSNPTVVLVCEALDTVAMVTVNNITVGKADNMFVRYVFDVKSALKVGDNTITIAFRSATQYVKEMAASLPYAILPTCVPHQYHGACGANLIRKTQCSFSWDWGPAFPTQGIWKDIYIQGYLEAVIRDVTTETSKGVDGSWRLNVDVFMEPTAGGPVHGHLEVKLAGTPIVSSKFVIIDPDHSKFSFDIAIPKSVSIGEWWPNGYGNQTLYELYVFYTSTLGTMNTRKVKVGFRTVELVQDYVSVNKSLGQTFYFRINGRPVFLKGSNWIPADSFLERVTRDRIYSYLKSAADVHMNAMRVWGGGIYEFDMFYEIADELGIMIWQDFMFACAMYPATDTFLASVRTEATQQVRRLKHHASIIALSGNNENEKALVQDWYGTDINYTRYKNDYLKLYVDTIRAVVLAEDTSRPFLSSSPSNGIETEVEGWISKQPYDTHYGDIHEYKYLVPFYDPTQYRIPRLSSEYGLQSYPSYESLEPVFNQSDMDYWSDLNEYRNHHPFGNIEMMAEAIQYLNLPNCPDRKQRFKDLIYVTQVDQAIGIRTMTENYRRWQNRLDAEGQGNTMGALYWMLADIWQAPTWASLEYGGKWKMLHYYAAHFFAPTLISPYVDGNVLDVYVVMDELSAKEVRDPTDHTLSFQAKTNPRPFSLFNMNTWGNSQAGSHVTSGDFSGTLYIRMFKWDSFVVLKMWAMPFQLNSTAQSVFRRDVDAMLADGGCGRPGRCFLVLHMGNEFSGPTSWLPLDTFRNSEGLQKANIQITDVRPGSASREFTISLTTDYPAPFVWLEAKGVKGRFSDNGFLIYQPNMTLTFYAWEDVDLSTLKSSLTVTSLMDTYY